MLSISIEKLEIQTWADTYIGVSRRVSITTDTQTIVLDGADENLPAGEYFAEVTFYPRWSAENGPAAAKAIVDEILGVADVELSGSGLGLLFKKRCEAQAVDSDRHNHQRPRNQRRYQYATSASS
jgi:hypothetical protein